MKLFFQIIISLFLVNTLFSQEIVITISPRSEGETIAWTINYDPNGMITTCTKKLIKNNETLNELIVKKENNFIYSLYTVKGLSIHNTFSPTEKTIEIISRQINSYNNTDITNSKKLIIENNTIKEYLNGSLISVYDYNTARILDDRGNPILERRNGNIQNYSEELTLWIEQSSDSIHIVERSIPQITADTLYKISGQISQLKKSLIENYILLPYELRFLLLL